MVRELVYLSKRKLVTFDCGRRRSLSARFKATVKASLGLGEVAVEVDAIPSKCPDLEVVLAELDRGERAPVWFTDEVMSGQWVQFEAPMAYTTIDTTVIFLDIDQPTDEYPTGGERRLMLHGSAEHLVGAGARPRTSVEELSQEAAARSVVDADGYESVFNHFFDLIEYASGNDVTSHDDRQTVVFRNRWSAAGLEHVLPTVGRHLRLPHTAAWVAGYARVTNVAPPTTEYRATTLFASPLYVEHVAPPRVDR